MTAEDAARARLRTRLTIWGAAILAVGIAGYLYKRSIDPIQAQKSFDAGVRLLKIARYPQAILSFDRAVALKSDFSDAYLERARAFVGDSQTERAVRDFTKVIELRPSDSAPMLERAQAYLELKDFQNAIGDAGRALAIDPKKAEAYAIRGIALRAVGDLRGALAEFSRALELAANESVYYERGATYQMLGEHRLAIADFSEVIAFHPDAAAAYFARAESLRATGESAEAEKDFHRGRTIDGQP